MDKEDRRLCPYCDDVMIIERLNGTLYWHCKYCSSLLEIKD